VIIRHIIQPLGSPKLIEHEADKPQLPEWLDEAGSELD
jgi:hypothetical protein